MLEVTCMRDEPLPQPMSMAGNVHSNGAPTMSMMSMANPTGPPMSNKPDVIAEMPHEA